MSDDLINTIYTQFIKTWEFDPDVIIINGILRGQENKIPIVLYQYVEVINDEIFRNIMFNVLNPYITKVYIIINNVSTNHLKYVHEKIEFILKSKTYGLTMNDIVAFFDKKTINIFLRDISILNYEKTKNLYYLNDYNIGVLSSKQLNTHILPFDINSFEGISTNDEKTQISVFNGFVVVGKVETNCDYYIVERGFENMLIREFNEMYDIVNMSVLTPTYLTNKLSMNNSCGYITQKYGINYPLVILNNDFVKEIKTPITFSEKDIFMELSYENIPTVSYTCLPKYLSIPDKQELGRLKTFLKYNMFNNIKKQYDEMYSQNIKNIEDHKKTLLQNLEKVYVDRKKTLESEYGKLRDNTESELSERFKQLQRVEENKIYEYKNSKLKEIDSMCSDQLKQRQQEIDIIISKKTIEEFDKLNALFESKLKQNMLEEDTKLNELKKKYKNAMEIEIKQLRQDRDKEILQYMESKKYDVDQTLETYKYNEEQKIRNEQTLKLQEEYQRLIEQQGETLQNLVSEMRNEKMKEIEHMVYEQKHNMLNEVNTEMKGYRDSKIEDIRNEVSDVEKSMKSQMTMNVEAEINLFKKTEMLKVEEEIKIFSQTLRQQAIDICDKDMNEIIEEKIRLMETTTNQMNIQYRRCEMDKINIELNTFRETKMEEIAQEVLKFEENLKKHRTEVIDMEIQTHKNAKMCDIIEDARNFSEKLKKEAIEKNNEYIESLNDEAVKKSQSIIETKMSEMLKELEETKRNMYNTMLEQNLKDLETETERHRHDKQIEINKYFEKIKSESEFEFSKHKQSVLLEFENEMKNARKNELDRIENLKTTKLARIDIEYELAMNKTNQRISDLYSKMRHDVIEKIKNETLEIHEETVQTMKVDLDAKYQLIISEYENNKRNQIDQVTRECEAEISIFKSRVDEDKERIESELVNYTRSQIDMFTKERRMHKERIEESLIREHNEKLSELRAKHEIARLDNIKKLEIELLELKNTMREKYLSEIKEESKREYDLQKEEIDNILNKYKIEQERIKKDELENFITKVKDAKLVDVDNEIIGLKRRLMDDLNTYMVKLEKEKKADLDKRIDEYKTTKQQDFITRFKLV
jgi:hypothetical protein